MKDDLNKRLCELLGINPVFEWVGPDDRKEHTYKNFFSEKGRIDLLKRLKEKGCVYEFLAKFAFPSDFVSWLLDDTGALARAALEFLERKEANHA